MPKIVKNGKEYSGVPLECVTAWQPTGDPVQVAEPLMGNTDISDIGDGTITGAVSAVDSRLGAKLLWSGNFSGSGSFTVNGLSEWLVVGYTSYESATNVEYLMIGTPARGGQPYGVYDSTSTTTVAYRFVVDGDTVTVNKQNRGLHFNSSTTYDNGSDAHVRHVFGLIKKPSSN